jgi:hypothetical protein
MFSTLPSSLEEGYTYFLAFVTSGFYAVCQFGFRLATLAVAYVAFTRGGVIFYPFSTNYGQTTNISYYITLIAVTKYALLD